MTKEQFTALGIGEELAAKAASESEKELKEYVPKHQYEEAEGENKSLKKTIKENEAALESLKKASGSQEEFTAQIQKMQDEAKEAERKHQEELREIRMMNAIKLAVTGKVHDEELVAGLFDRSKLILGEDGKVTGLDEQLRSMKESRSFLFKPDEPSPQPGFHKIGGNPPSGGGDTGKMSMREAIQAKLQSQIPQK